MSVLAENFYNGLSQVEILSDLYLMNCKQDIKVLSRRNFDNYEDNSQVYFVYDAFTKNDIRENSMGT